MNKQPNSMKRKRKCVVAVEREHNDEDKKQRSTWRSLMIRCQNRLRVVSMIKEMIDDVRHRMQRQLAKQRHQNLMLSMLSHRFNLNGIATVVIVFIISFTTRQSTFIHSFASFQFPN